MLAGLIVFAKYTKYLNHVQMSISIAACMTCYCLFIGRNNAKNRKLWDKTNEKWTHDKYVESEQAPKTKEELEVNRIFYIINYKIFVIKLSEEILTHFVRA